MRRGQIHKSPWRETSRRVIEQALADGRAAGLDGPALERFVRERYPFGARKNYPYKVWLNEFALLVRGERKAMATGRMKKRSRFAGEPAGQGTLFGETS